MTRRARRKVPVETFEQAQKNPDPDYARIVLPESGPELEQALEVIKTDKRCAKCAHFDFDLGQKALYDKDNPVMLQMLKEHNLGTLVQSIDPSSIGACRQWSHGGDGLVLVHAISPAKVARQFTGSYNKNNRNEMVDCPDYHEVQGRVLRFYKRNQ